MSEPDIAPFHVADLFAGAGGLTEGFRQAAFRPVVAVEFDRWAAQTYAANFGAHVLPVPIENVSVEQRADGSTVWSVKDQLHPQTIETPPIDVLVGAPPVKALVRSDA